MGRGAGWYVRRLEIYTYSWTPALVSAAARIVRCCPNLRVLTIGATEGPSTAADKEGVPIEVIDALFNTCPHSLRALDWTVDLGSSTTREMFMQLPKMKLLQSFFMYQQLPLGLPLTYNELCRIRAVELPCLHTLEIASDDDDPSEVLGVMAYWVLPSLKKVALCGQRRLQNADSFFIAHGPRLRIFEFDRIGDNAHRVLELCSKLTELVTHIRYAEEQILGGHPNVRCLGLRGMYRVQDSYATRCDAIQALKAVFPSLSDGKRYPCIKFMRLLDYEQSQFTEQKWRASDVVFLAYWVKKFDREGPRLEDHEGEVFKVKFSQATVLLPEEMAVQYVPILH